LFACPQAAANAAEGSGHFLICPLRQGFFEMTGLTGLDIARFHRKPGTWPFAGRVGPELPFNEIACLPQPAIISLLGISVLLQYRAMIPLMFALLLLHQLGARLVLLFVPIVRAGTPPGFYVNLVLLAVMIVGLALSLWSRDKLQARE